MAKFRAVKSSFWNDEKVVDLFTPEDRLFFLYLLTNPHTTQLGIYQFVPRIAAFELGYSVESIKAFLERFENNYNMIRYSKKTGEIAIKNYLLHSIIKGGKPVFDCLKKEEYEVKDKSLVVYIVNHLSCRESLNSTVEDFIRYVNEKKYEDDKRYMSNENDNENERIVSAKALKIKNIIVSEATKLSDTGNYKCEWCGNMVPLLEKHHFPIPRAFGGLHTVSICHNCHTKFHKLEYEIDIGKSKSEKDINELADEFFERIWELYPKKRGKGDVKPKQRKELYRIGYDQLSRCIDRYRKEIQGKNQQYVKNGGTFFNSGYVDYLDENYVPPVSTTESALRSFLQGGA